MLQLRPNCECCDKDLPPNSTEAMICTYECTFCRTCVEDILSNVCPNCGGGFCPRPIRPQVARRPGVGLEFQPPSEKRVKSKFSHEEMQVFAESLREIAAEVR
ncbi:DUF1272 domain-containing protein [Microbulbifer sp. THAF38]|uniref:DUF1272 domain-containing protein n=1 Tax=unclassified Microbulbifer TaxID=2619833 RepID=UPI001268D777|nr:DUF1272 domain-containing protein [Microbulbifer sp. THAF38]QFT56568.1 hypothetical protein FIU95_18635 [Microbulbifer sp. THAF38]